MCAATGLAIDTSPKRPTAHQGLGRECDRPVRAAGGCPIGRCASGDAGCRSPVRMEREGRETRRGGDVSNCVALSVG
jgi:hypothetical protein